MAEKKIENMDSGQINPQFLQQDAFLKPKLDSIFAEVQASLPSIDFEVSDMSSDEDMPIFHRSLKTPTSDEDSNISSHDQDYRDLLNNTNLDDITSNVEPTLHHSNHHQYYEYEDRSASPPSLDNALFDALNAGSFTSMDDIEKMVINRNKSRAKPASAKLGISKAVGSDSVDSIMEGIKARPKSAGDALSYISTPSSSSKGYIPISPLKNTWVQTDYDEDLIEDTAPESPTMLEKRKEIPELSPKSRGERSTKSMKSKKQLKVSPVEHEDSKTVVSQYFNAMPSITLESVDLDEICLGIITGSREVPPGDDQQGVEREPSLIQKLAKLSLGQNVVNQDIDPTTGAMHSRKIGQKDLKTARNQAVIAIDSQKKGSMGTNTTDLTNLPRAEIPSPKPPKTISDEKPTVFIDLRGFAKKQEETQHKFQSVQRILGISPDTQDSSSSDESDSEEMLWHEQRKKIKESLSKTGTVPLPSKLKTRKVETKPALPVIQTHAQRLAGHLPKPKSDEDDTENQAVETTPIEEETEQQPEQQKTPEEMEKEELLRKVQEAKKKRAEREAERQSRIRLGKRLEALRPTESSTKKQQAAETTPTLFDADASYEPSPSTLPGLVMPHHELLLLTVNLSSNGEVVLHRSKTNQGVDTGLGLSATYTTVLTWLLSRVPDDYSFLQEPHSHPTSLDAPFYVVGMQQIHLDGQLALYIAITPIESFSTIAGGDKKGGKKSKQLRDELKDSSVFQKAVQRYLTSNRLQTVCPWLNDLVSVEVESRVKLSSNSNNKETYVYRPNLPNITQKPLSTFVQMNPDPNAVFKVFGLECGFFWETVETDEVSPDSCIKDEGVEYDTQNTMSLIYKKIYRNPNAIMGILNRVLQEGFDLAGVRLLYPTVEVMKAGVATSSLPAVLMSQTDSQTPMEVLNNVGPILAISIRGAFARMLWLDAIGPSDPVLARRTDPQSLCALYGGESREQCLLFCPRNSTRIQTELARWFGGRVPASGVIDVGHAAQKEQSTTPPSKVGGGRKKKGQNAKGQDILQYKPPATLTASTKGSLFLVVSPQIPVKCMGLLLATAQRRGYQLRGVRRIRLTSKHSHVLGIPVSRIPVFSISTSTPVSPVPGKQVPLSLFDFDGSDQHKAPTTNPCTVFELCKENAVHTVASLIEAFMVQMSFLNILGSLRKTTSDEVSPADFFHIAPFTDQLLVSLGGDFTKCPEAELGTTPGYIAPMLYSNPELEEIVVLTLTGHAFMKNFGLFLGKLQNVVPYNQTSPMPALQEGFELLGLKWLPGLSMQHAKELTPYEVGDKSWKNSIRLLTSEPAVILVLRGINAFRRLEASISLKTLSTTQKSSALDRIMSPTPELAYRQVCLFFKPRELFADNSARSLVPYLPPIRSPAKVESEFSTKGKKGKGVLKSIEITPSIVEENIVHTMQAGPRPLTTVLVVKSDVVHKNLTKLLRRVTHEGFRVVGMRLEVLDHQMAANIVPPADRQDECLEKLHTDYMTSSSSLLLCLQRENAVKKLLDCLGPQDPKEARRQSQFFWRAVFGSDCVANGLHGSSNYKMSVLEVKMFFPQGLCCEEIDDVIAEGIACPGEDVIINTKSKSQRKVVFTSDEMDEVQSSATKSHTTSSGTTGPRVLPVTPLTQTNCLLLTPSLLQTEGRSKRFPYVEIMEHLATQGFEIVGMRMVWLTTEQAQQYLHIINAGTFHLVPCLTSGPCLIIAIQRDNAVLAFDGYLGSSFDKESIISKYNFELMRAKDLKQASNLLQFFFDKLSPESHAQIQTVSKPS